MLLLPLLVINVVAGIIYSLPRTEVEEKNWEICLHRSSAKKRVIQLWIPVAHLVPAVANSLVDGGAAAAAPGWASEQ